MDKLILIVHFLACFLLIVVVLLQSGKGSATGIFSGGGGGDALFAASSGSNFIKRFTMGLALTIALTSIMLTVVRNRSGMTSVVDRYQAPAAQGAPAPAPAAPAQPAK